MSAGREIVVELDAAAERLRALGALEEAHWTRRAADHIEFLETRLQTDAIDAVEHDDRKQILDVFQDANPGTVTVEGPLRDGLYDMLLAVARWGARSAFDRMTERREPSPGRPLAGGSVFFQAAEPSRSVLRPGDYWGKPLEHGGYAFKRRTEDGWESLS